jgi:GNAT superfamily N-acetyltransferase
MEQAPAKVEVPELTIRELKPAEIDRMLVFRNAIFGNLLRDQWDAMNCTAVVATAGPGEEFWGAIPLQYRSFRLNPRVSIPVVFENAVGVSEKARDMGIGTRMLQEAAKFLHDRVDALFVYRGNERSIGYRFYRKTHHGDLYFVDYLQLTEPKGADNDVEVLPPDKTFALEPKLLRIWHAVYGHMGGCWERKPGYFRQVVTSHVYRNDKCRLFLARKRGRLTGYAFTNPESKIWKGYCIYDLAAADRATYRRLLEKIEFLARQASLPVTFPSNVEHPLNAFLYRCGFQWQSNSPFTMAYILRPDRIFARLAKGSPLLKTLKLTILTPHRDLVANDPAKPKCEATLYCKESQLSRLMCCRLDLGAALRTNQVRLFPATLPSAVPRELCRIFAPCPWLTCGLDYI